MRKKVFGVAVCLLFVASIASASITQGLDVDVSTVETAEPSIGQLGLLGVAAIPEMPEQIADSLLVNVMQLDGPAQLVDDLTVEVDGNVSFEQNSDAIALITAGDITLNQTGLFSSLTSN